MWVYDLWEVFRIKQETINMKTHKDLDVWKGSIELALEVYRLTKMFPGDELWCLARQLRKAAISVPSNISEGAARNQKREFIRFLKISAGSLAEIETQVIIAGKLGYFNEEDTIPVFGQIKRTRTQLSGLIKYLEKQLSP